MDSSMSVSSLSFEEDEFDDNSSDNEIRFVDIEKEILNKKAEDTGNIINAPKHANTLSEKENLNQKMLHIGNLGLRPKFPSESKAFAVKSQESKMGSNKIISTTTTEPLKHFAYRTPKATTKQNTLPVVTQDTVKRNESSSIKVKYFATRSNAKTKTFGEDLLPCAKDSNSVDPSVYRTKSSNVEQSKPKADNVTNIIESSAVSFESENSENEPDAPEIPNLNNIEIIDESGNEDDSPPSNQINTPMDIDNVVDYDKKKERVSLLKPEVDRRTPQFAIRSSQSKSLLKSTSVKLPVTSTSKPVATRTVLKPTKSALPLAAFRTIAPKPTEEVKLSPSPNSTKKSSEENHDRLDSSPPIDVDAIADAGTDNSADRVVTPKSATSKESPVTMPARSMVVHSSTPALSLNNLPALTSMTQSLNFVVPKEDIIKYKLNNTPLILSVPPLVAPDGNQITPTTGRSLLMILPQQLPSNLQGPGVVNFLVTNPHFKPNVSVQIPAASRDPNSTPLKNITTNRLLTTQEKKKRASEVSPTEDVKLLNTKEKDGPNWCWYVPRFGKRDLEGFLYKDRLGFSRTETDKVRKCLRKLNLMVYTKQCELDEIASNIIKLKRGMKPTQTAAMKGATLTEKPLILRRSRPISDQKSLPHMHENLSHKGFIVSHEQSNEIDSTNQIKIVSVASLSERNEDGTFLLGEEQTDSPAMPMDDHSGDDCSSDLYYTKKVVILRNRHPHLHKRKTKRITPLPKIKLRQNRLAIQGNQKFRPHKPVLPPVKKCSVVLRRDEELEKVIREKFDLKDRSRRKRKLDLESMGLIKKVRRRNAIDTPPDNEISKIDTKFLRFETNLTVSSGNKDNSPVRTSPKLKTVQDKVTSLAHGHQKSSTKTTCEPKNKPKADDYVMINEDIEHDELASSSSSSLKMASEKTFDLTTGHKKNAHDYKKSVFMSYRERQKISSLTHAERRFIFALNTIHSLEDLRLDDKKPLLVLDQHNVERDLASVTFNFKFDFESMNNYNVVFARDDDEALPPALLKNLKLVYLVRHGHIKVVSRPVLCKYLLEKCNLVKKPVEKMQLKEVHSKNRDDKYLKKGRDVETSRHKTNAKDDVNKKHSINIRNDLITPKSVGDASSLLKTKEKCNQEKAREVKSPVKSSFQTLDKKRMSQKSEKKPTSLIKISLKDNSDSLDTKFNEIEKNLSMMFDKAKPSTSGISKANQSSTANKMLHTYKNVGSSKDVEVSNSEAVHTADLDYLFTNSGDENSNLGKGQKNEINILAKGSKKSKVKDKLEENNQTSLNKNQKDGTAKMLEELLTSPVTESDQIPEFRTNSLSVAVLEKDKFTENPNTQCHETTNTVRTQFELPTHLPVSSTDHKQETGHNTKDKSIIHSNNEDIHMETMPIQMEDDQGINKVSRGPKCGNETKILTEKVLDKHIDTKTASKMHKDCDKQKQDTAESDHSSGKMQSDNNKQDERPHIRESTFLASSDCLDIEQFLEKSCIERPNPINEEFSSGKNNDDISKTNVSLSEVADNEDVTKHSQENTVQSEMGVHEHEPMDVSENDSNVDTIFTDTLSQQPNSSTETDPVIAQDENLLYLMPDKSGDTGSIPADISSDVSMGPLQVSSSNMDDVEGSVPSFETNQDLNEPVTENLINSSSEFELFNNASNKVADESSSIVSRNLALDDDTNDPESPMITLETKKSTDADLLTSCEIDTDISMCSDEISKNLPDDYLEK